MYVIYNKETTRLAGGSMYPKRFETMRGAKGYLTRISNRDPMDKGIVAIGGRDAYAIATEETFYTRIEKKVTKKNMMSGKEFTQPVNTPLCCDPSSETYWSM